MSGIVSLLLAGGQYAFKPFPHILPLRDFPNAPTWLAVGFICIFVARYRAWKDERRKVLGLREHYENAPRIALTTYRAYDGRQWFALENTADYAAVNLRVPPIKL